MKLLFYSHCVQAVVASEGRNDLHRYWLARWPSLGDDKVKLPIIT